MNDITVRTDSAIHADKPIWASKRFVTYHVTLLVMLGLVLLHGPDAAIAALGQAIAFALPVLIGGESYLRAKGVEAKTALAASAISAVGAQP